MPSTNTATDAVKRQEANRRFESRFSSVDRIINPGIDKLELVDQTNGQVAWTDGKTITLNVAQLPNFVTAKPEEWATILGANLHEIGHTFYSPRQDSTLVKTLKGLASTNSSLKMIENLVEDQRQERLLVAQFGPPAVAMLTAVAVNLVVASTEGNLDAPMERLWPLIAGRTWLPADLRRKARDAWTGDSTKLAELIGRYQRLADPAENEADKAIRLLLEIQKMVEDEAEDGSGTGGCRGHGGITVTQGEDMPAETGDDQVPSAGSAEDDLDAEDGDEGGSEDNGEDGESDPSADGSEASNGDNKMSNDAGDESQGKAPATTGDAVDQLEKAVKDLIANDEQVAQKLDEGRDAVSDISGSEGSNLVDEDGIRMETAPDEIMTVAWDVGQTLRGFVDEATPMVVRRTNTGRLNVKRWMDRKPHEPFSGLFDKRTPNRLEDVSLDVTVLVDVSSSMRSIMDKASEAAWAVSQGVERAEGDCTVVAYNQGATVVRQTGERSHPTAVDYLAARGGTDPTMALRDTWARLQNVQAANKVVIAITDGDWGYPEAGELMTDLRENHGVITVGVILSKTGNWDAMSDFDKSEILKHEAARIEKMGTGRDSSAVISDPHEIVPLFERVVADTMARAL